MTGYFQLMKRFIYSILITLTCSTCGSPQPFEKNIVLVNIGQLDRNGIAKEISALCSMGPKVLAIDIRLTGRKSNDLNLITALWNCQCKIILPALFEQAGNNLFYFASAAEPEFIPLNSKIGYVNVVHERDHLGTLKRFVPKRKDSFGPDVMLHFSILTAMEYDSAATTKFLENCSDTIDIDFKQGRRTFKTFSTDQLLNGKVNGSEISGKIVMLGFLGPGNEDKFFTPLNKNSRKPDMYGLEYLANVVCQVFE